MAIGHSWLDCADIAHCSRLMYVRDMNTSNSPYWVLVMTQPRRELWAAENVVRQGYDYYLPLCLEAEHKNNEEHFVEKPLFPGYMFVQVVAQWRTLLSTFGVSQVIMIGNNPVSVPDSVIDGLRESEKSGLIKLFKRSGNYMELNQGQSVGIGVSTFAGHIGLYDGMKGEARAYVLLDLLGRKTRVDVSYTGLNPVQ